MTLLLLAAGALVWPRRSPLRRRRSINVGVAAWVRPSALAGSGGGMAVLVWLVLPSPAVAAATVLALGTGGLLARMAFKQRRRRQTSAATIQAVRALARELQAGAGLDRAVGAVLPTTPILARPLLQRLSASAHLEEDHLAGPDDPLERSLLAGLRMSRRFGIPLAQLMFRVADGLEDEVVADEQRASAVAGAKLSGYLLAGLPVIGVLLGMGMGANPLPVLFGGGAGSVLLIVGVTLTCGGLLWSARIAS